MRAPVPDILSAMDDPGAPSPSAAEQPRKPAARATTLAGAVRAVSGVTLLSRFGGLARDIVLVRTFGDTVVGSAFSSAFQIPNMFRRLFGEGALSAAFVPEYTDAVRAGDHDPAGPSATSASHPTEADRFASLVILALGVVTGAITVLVEVVLFGLLLLTAPNPEQRLSILLIAIMLPFMPLVCMTAIKAGMLQVHSRFGASMSGPLILNTFIIVVGGYCWFTGHLAGAKVAYVLAFATVLSGLTQLLYFARLLRPHFRFVRPLIARASDAQDPLAPARPRARRMLRRFVPVMLGLGTLQLNAFIDTLISMWPIWVGPTLLGFAYPLDGSSAAIMTFTQRLYQFPLGVFGIAVATAAFPMLSRHAGEPEKFLHTIQRGVRLSLFIGLPASIGLALIREDAVSVLFGFGKSGFSSGGLTRSAAVLLGFSVGIWAYSLNHLFTRVFYARGDTRTPMNVSIAMVAVNLALNLTLIWDYRAIGVPLHLREAGLAWSTSLCAMLQTLILARLSRRFLPPHAMFDRVTVVGCAKVALAAAVMGLMVWAFLGIWGPRSTWTQHAVSLGASVALGGVTFLAAAIALRTHELRWLFHREP